MKMKIKKNKEHPKEKSVHFREDDILDVSTNQENIGNAVVLDDDDLDNTQWQSIAASQQLVQNNLVVDSSYQLQSQSKHLTILNNKPKFYLNDLNEVARKLIVKIATKEEYVTLQKVTDMLFTELNVSSVNELGLKRLNEIKCMENLRQLEACVNATIDAFITVRAICTYHDLHQCLVERLHNLTKMLDVNQENLSSVKFESFGLGPLNRIPVVCKFFEITPGRKMHQITALEVFDCLRSYMAKNKWKRFIEVEAFITYMAEEHQVAHKGTDLGVKINRFGLVIEILRNAENNWDFGDMLRNLKRKVQVDLVDAFNHFRDSILHPIDTEHVYPVTGDKLYGIRSEYFEKDPCTTMKHFISKLHYLYTKVEGKEDENLADVQNKHKKMKHKKSHTIQNFRDILHGDTIAAQLVQIAVCCSQEEISHELSAIFGSSVDANVEVSQPSKKENDYSSLSSEEIEQKVLYYLSTCFENEPLTLKLLSSIEEKLLEDVKLKHFGEVSEKGFLSFLSESSEITKLLEEKDGVTLGSSSSSQSDCYRPSRDEMLNFLFQCTYFGAKDRLDVMKAAVCQHFRTVDIRDAVCRDLGHMIKFVKNQKRIWDKNVIYEAALLGKHIKSAVTQKKNVGLWGPVKREQALLCLHSCPLLTDLSKWSNWDLVFGSELGDLKSFLRQNGGVQQINLSKIDPSCKDVLQVQVVALEVQPGTWLKLAHSSSVESFEEGLKTWDPVATSGHLVSCVVSQGGVESFSEELFANRLKAHLLCSGNINKNDQEVQDLKTASFIFDCIFILPDLIAVSLIQKVFLEPLNKVFGQARSKKLIITAASNSIEKLNKLERLGFLLGIREWFVESFSMKMKLKEIGKLSFDESPVKNTSSGRKRKRDDSEMSKSKNKIKSLERPAKKMVVNTSSSDENSSSDEDKKISKSKKAARSPKKIVHKSSSSEEEASCGAFERMDCTGTELLDKIRTDLLRLKSDRGPEDKPPQSHKDLKSKNCGGHKDKLTDAFNKNTSGNPEAVENWSSQATHLAKLNHGSADQKISTQWQQLVEEIRREKFGIGFNLEGEVMELFKNQHGMLGRSLERLSVDLYSKDMHFILELVQNADDNRYPDNIDNIPSLLFTLRQDTIIVSNNEVGFRDVDLRAICNVAESTKGKHKTGYIGEKGIGFKSVFRVSNQPEIHSRGLHIKFDVNCGSLGYIVPHWVGSQSDFYNDKKIKDNELSGYTTQIILPLKEDAKESSVQSGFHDLHPSLLLFLNRLRRIVIYDELKEETRSMLRHDLNDHMTEILHDGKREKWVFVKLLADASEVSNEAKSGVKVQSTELAIAFPVEDFNIDKSELNNSLPPKQPVFAFLPLRSYGFRFIVHADFDVTSSREDVIDNLWNQWLRSKIHVLFLEALEFFKKREGCDPIKELCNFFKFIPREDEILDFFRQVALNIINGLKVTKCLPSVGNKWCLPSQLLLCDDPKTCQFATSDFLLSQMDLDYLHPLVASSVDRSILLDVGVQLLNSKHLIQVGRAMIKHISKEIESCDFISDSSISQISTWLTCIYWSLKEFSHEAKEAIELMKNMSFVPLSSGKLVSMDSNETIFFPFASEKHMLENNQLSKKMMKLFEQDMNSVDDRLVTLLDDNVIKSQISSLLEKIGVKKLNDEGIVKHHILPSLKNPEKCKNMSKELLVAYTFHLKNYFTLHPSSFTALEVSKYLPISTNIGFVKLTESSVHFTPNYNNRIHLQHQLPGLEWTLLDKCYLNKNKSDSNVTAWRDFFRRLGVQDFLSFTKKEYIMTKTELLNSKWSSHVNLLKEAKFCVIEDWVCEEFTELITLKTDDDTHHNQQMQILFELINQYWEGNSMESRLPMCALSHYLEATFKVDDVAETVLSSFGLALKYSKWIPTWKLDILTFKDNGKLRRIKKLKSRYENAESFSDLPLQRYLVLSVSDAAIVADFKSAITLLGHNALYVPLKAELIKKSLADFLNIQISIDASYVVKQLVNWCTGNENTINTNNDLSPVDVPIFHDLVSRMDRVYTYLEDSMSKKELIKLAKDYPLIFCANDETSGSFFYSDEVCWEDSTGLVENYSSAVNEFCKVHDPVPNQRNRLVGVLPRILEKMYATNKKDFFTRICNVNASPPLSAYAHILLYITNSFDSVSDSLLVDVLKIFAVLGKAFSSLESDFVEEKNKVIDMLKKKKFLPSKSGQWVGISNMPIIGDDKGLEKIFEDVSIDYVNLGEKELSECHRFDITNVINFLTTVGVRRLTECVTVSLKSEGFRPCALLEKYVSHVVPYIQRCLSSEFPVIYEHLLSCVEVSDKLSRMRFVEMDSLELEYTLERRSRKRNRISTAVVNKTCQMFDEIFYIQQDNASNYLDINRELSAYFSRLGHPCPSDVNSLAESCFKELRNLLSEITPLIISGHEHVIESIMEDRSLVSLPSTIDVWKMSSSSISVTIPLSTSNVCEFQHIKSHSCITDSNYLTDIKVPDNLRPLLYGNLQNKEQMNISFRPASVEKRFPAFRHAIQNFPVAGKIQVEVPVNEETGITSELPIENISGEGNNCHNPEQIGRLGELFVFNYLQRMSLTEDSDIAEVIDMNADEATIAPYDIIVKRKSDLSPYFIEVKSTAGLNKSWFEISLPELASAVDLGQNYHVYRVFGIGQDRSKVKMTKIENLFEALRSKCVRLSVQVGSQDNIGQL